MICPFQEASVQFFQRGFFKVQFQALAFSPDEESKLGKLPDRGFNRPGAKIHQYKVTT